MLGGPVQLLDDHGNTAGEGHSTKMVVAAEMLVVPFLPR